MDDEDELAKLARTVREIHAAGGFNLHKIESNSRKVLAVLNAKNGSGVREVHQQNACSVLGRVWETEEDTFSFRLRRDKLGVGFLEGTSVPTKRKALSTVMSIYDPLGLLSHKTVELKLIMREAWLAQIQWDDKLPEELQVFFKVLLS